MEILTVLPEEEELPADLALILARAHARNQKRYHDMKIIAGITLSVIPAALIMTIIPHGIFFLPFMALIIEFCLVSFALSRVMQRRKGAYGLNEQDLEQLATIHDKRVLKVLLDVPFDLANKPIALRRGELLKHWLPSLTSGDADFLSKRQRQRLTSGIHMFKEDVTQKIFSALEQIGDADQLPSLKGWKYKQAGMRVKPETLAAYKSCLAAIEARVASTRSDAQLLRPSSSTDGADIYLRPVTQKIDENAETLLRSDLTPRSPLPIPSCFGEEGENHEETSDDRVRESKP